MKFYFIVSTKEDTPPRDLLNKLKPQGKVLIIRHKGQLAEIEQLKKDREEKILGVDPKVFDWDLDAESLKDVPNVKAICTSSTSFDWLKPKQLKKMGIVACNVSGWSSDTVAEYALSMAINVTRGLPIVIKNNWKYSVDDFLPMLLKGKTAGIVGLGRIGTRMAELCQGIGMNVVYWSRKSRDKRFKYVGIDKLFKQADLIMPALVENSQTRKIITRKRLDLMKPTAVLVGINRVRVLWDEDYVFEKVRKKEIGGYALEGEGLKPPAKYKGNVLPLPSMAGYTKDAFENLIKIWVENIKAIAEGKSQNVVN
jgi:lactate dehydrogenase-like 2-hydroxyacid dehydrogenase